MRTEIKAVRGTHPTAFSIKKEGKIMPYNSNKELPIGVKNHLPAHAQDIYREAFNSAWDQYKDSKKRRHQSQEEVAHKVAWSAVKEQYIKKADKWVPIK